MQSTTYMDKSGKKMIDRHKTPCPRIERKGLQTTVYRDKDPNSLASQRKLSLNEFLGLDSRGSCALSKVKSRIMIKCADNTGQGKGHGPLGTRNPPYLTVDLASEADEVLETARSKALTTVGFFPTPRRTIFYNG